MHCTCITISYFFVLLGNSYITWVPAKIIQPVNLGIFHLPAVDDNVDTGVYHQHEVGDVGDHVTPGNIWNVMDF